MSGEVRVFYFAAARELCGTPDESLALPESADCDTRALMQLLADRHPRLRPFIERMRFAVNGELVDLDHVIRGGDEIAVLPPVAGGSPGEVLCALRDTALSLDEVVAALRRPEAGGIALFLGVVRDHADDKPVARLDYEAHPQLALQTMQAIAAEVSALWPQARLAMVHRVGQLAVGELAVIVGASTPHRAEAFAACREVIERLKQRVPIWKKEWSPDGNADWVNLKG